jgi:ribosomal protein S18 acetylase RimI-like enzyme
MAPPPPLRARLQAFDSGKIAPRVGSVVLSEGVTISDDAILDLIESAASEEFDLVWIETRSKLETTLLDYRGTIVEFAGDRQEALARARLTTLRYDVRALQCDSDWADVEELMRFAAPTRFNTDPHIAEASFRQHKLSLMKGHVATKHGMVALAYSPGDRKRAVGYHCASLDEQTTTMYEIAVDRDFRGGFAALSLIGYSLEHFVALHPGARRLAARIYEDNPASQRFFRKLGLAPTEQTLHYYHCWPMLKERP